MTVPVPSPSEPARSRRTVLAAAAGGLLAAVAGALGRPTPAAASHLLGFGHVNNAGAANTTLTTSSTGTAMLVTQNGAGTALRGSATNGIAGFFTSANGSGVSGVVAANTKYGVYGGNDATTYGGGAAIRAAGGQNHGLVATTLNPNASGVRGINTMPSGTGNGVYGEGGIGVYGLSVSGTGIFGSSTSSYGLVGTTDTGTAAWAASESGFGIFGSSQSTYAIFGSSDAGVAVYGQSNSNDAIQGIISTDYKSGIVGSNPNALGWAGYFQGNVEVTGVLSGPTVLSRIDHPLDPANQTLAHAFVGSPEMKNVYDGTVTLDSGGQATVTLPSYFEALNADIRYQLTAIGTAAPNLHVAAEVKKGQFRIAGGPSGAKVCWLVTGVRRDAHAVANPIKVEAAKPAARRGRYLNPSAHGQPESKGWKDLSAPGQLPTPPTFIKTDSPPAP